MTVTINGTTGIDKVAPGAVETADLPAGTVLQVVNANLTGYFGTTATFPIDDSLPQNTEGAEVLTCAITPTSATSKLIIDVIMNATGSDASYINGVFLFQDSTANTLRGAWSRTVAGQNPVSPMVVKHYMTSGTTSSTTFKVRIGTVGGTGAQTMQLNGGSGTSYLGGALISSITITEIAA